MDKVAVTNAEKTAAVEQLQAAIKWEKKLQEEISYMTADLQSSRAEIESAYQNITSLESQIKSKKHSISRLRRERDGCIEELEVECGRHRTTIKMLALADTESASAKAEAESTKDVLSLAIKLKPCIQISPTLLAHTLIPKYQIVDRQVYKFAHHSLESKLIFIFT